jgi:hypothetical protein
MSIVAKLIVFLLGGGCFGGVAWNALHYLFGKFVRDWASVTNKEPLTKIQVILYLTFVLGPALTFGVVTGWILAKGAG